MEWNGAPKGSCVSDVELLLEDLRRRRLMLDALIRAAEEYRELSAWEKRFTGEHSQPISHMDPPQPPSSDHSASDRSEDPRVPTDFVDFSPSLGKKWLLKQKSH